MFKEIVVTNNDIVIGSISGHLNISKSSFLIENYFCIKHKLEKDKLQKILKNIPDDSISILMNMFVEEDYRGNGVGNQLIDNFFDYNKSPILLLCDISESEWLESWYNRIGFGTVENIHGLPIMLKP